MTAEFVGVTELQGQRISREQLARMCHRYRWAQGICQNADTLEVACGAGQGLGILVQGAKSLVAGDFSPEVLATAIANFPHASLSVFGAEKLPFPDDSFDCVLLFEALYYVDAAAFFAEAERVLRPDGSLLIATANKDLYDFTPSPFTKRYLGAAELARELGDRGFAVELAGYIDTSRTGFRQRLLRPIKAVVSRFGLMPKTMRGKELLKKLFFGEMTVMPTDLTTIPFDYEPPEPIGTQADRRHKVIYCRATRP